MSPIIAAFVKDDYAQMIRECTIMILMYQSFCWCLLVCTVMSVDVK